MIKESIQNICLQPKHMFTTMCMFGILFITNKKHSVHGLA